MEPSVTPRRRLRAALSTVVLGAAAAVLAGCGTVGHTDAAGDSQRGKQLFVDNCGSCHALADAGTQGTIGPDLDDMPDEWKGIFGVDEVPADAVRKYREFALSKSELERQAEGRDKTGVFTGAFATNPTNGASIPIFVRRVAIASTAPGDSLKRSAIAASAIVVAVRCAANGGNRAQMGRCRTRAICPPGPRARALRGRGGLRLGDGLSAGREAPGARRGDVS